jgi:ParB family chromosome partitioning protein
LSDSIRTHGVLQPVLVAELPAGDDGAGRYRLIAGERRLRAAELAGVAELPCIVRAEQGAGLLEVALIENIQRSDLNPIERANAFREMMDSFSLTQDQVAQRLGLPRPTVANHLRLLDLCDDVQKLLVDGSLSFGHGKVLAALAGDAARQVKLAKAVAARGLSVRQLEELVKAGTEAKPDKEGQTQINKSPYLSDVERQLSERVGTRVTIRPGRAKHSGRIVLEYYTLADFDRLVEALGGKLES